MHRTNVVLENTLIGYFLTVNVLGSGVNTFTLQEVHGRHASFTQNVLVSLAERERVK